MRNSPGIEALENSHLMLLGGMPVGARFLYWNFVSSSEERAEQVKADWPEGPHLNSARFQPIPNDQKEFSPLPVEPGKNPKGTIL